MADPNKLKMDIVQDHYGYYVAFKTRGGRMVSEGHGNSIEHAAMNAIEYLDSIAQDARDTFHRYLSGN